MKLWLLEIYPNLLRENIINQPIFFGFICRKEIVPIAIMSNLLNGFAGMFGKNSIESISCFKHFPCMNFDIRSLSLQSANPWLMNQYFRIRQRSSFTISTSCKENSAHACSHSYTDSSDVGFNIFHCVIYCQPCCNTAAGGIDVKIDILF